MKKFIIRSMLTIIIPVIAFIYGYEIVMRSIPNDYSYKNELWEEKVDSIQVLILGSSHCYYAFNPEYFDKYAFNAAHVSQSYNYDWFILNKYIDRMGKLEYVILPLTIISPNQILEQGEEAWRCVDYSVHYGCRYHHWWELKMRYYFLYLSLPNALRAVNRIKNSGFNDIHIDHNGYALKTIKDQVNNMSKSGVERAKHHSYGKEFQSNYEVNMNYLDNIIIRCREQGVKMIIVTTPAIKEYYNSLAPNQIEVIEGIGERLGKADDIQYINLLKSEDYAPSDFFDADHLCDTGAEKISVFINKIINNWE